jgi:hypothetical protein
MEHPTDAGSTALGDHRQGVLLGVAGVDDHRPIQLTTEFELRRERAALLVPRGMIVVRIEAAFADRHSASAHELADGVGIAERVERRGVVRVHPCRGEHKPRMGAGDDGSPLRRSNRFSDADYCLCPVQACTLDGPLAVRVECRIREVCVAIDECGVDYRVPVPMGRGRSASWRRVSARAREVPLVSPMFRGHLCSIHSKMAPAT